MIVMHGYFDMADAIPEGDFKKAFDSFSLHLHGLGYVQSWSFKRRQPHDGYDNRPPNGSFSVSVNFANMVTAQACYDYVAANNEPLRSLHRAVFSKVVKSTTSFVLLEEVAPQG